MYKGILDGSIFCDFYDDKDDCEIKNVEWWADIDEAPFWVK